MVRHLRPRRRDLVRAIGDLVAGRPVLAPAALAALAGRSGSSARPGQTRVALTDREVEVLRLVAEDLTNRAAAGRLGSSEATVKTHLLHVDEKPAVPDRASAARTAWELGLV